MNRQVVPIDVPLSVTGFRSELVRKTLHILIAVIPTLASIHLSGTISLVAFGTLFYILSETFRLRGRPMPFISDVTILAQRERDVGHFVMGPVTLGLGALWALVFCPPLTAAIAIYALAFGDSVASFFGRFFGSHRPSFLWGKSLEGSCCCLLAVFYSTFLITGKVLISLCSAAIASAVEALPLDDWDNVFIPVGVGLFFTII